MNVLLTSLNSKYVHSNLALKYLYMAGKPYCETLHIREFTINNSRDYVFSELVMGDYDAVCFSCYIWNIEKTIQLASDLKKARPEVRILFGGPEVSYDCGAFMRKHPFVDFLLAGEGERAFAMWCQAFSGALAYERVPGLTWRGGDTVLENPLAAPIPLERIPFPYGEFACEQDKVIYYEASRGCPFNCSYCISSLDRRVRSLPTERVKSDLQRFAEQKVRQVKFLDRTFNWDRERSLALLGYMMEMDEGVTNFHLEICADLLDDELFASLSRARKGLFQFEIGIQSTNEKTLRAVNRFNSIKKTLENVKKLVALGNSHVHVDLIAGLPFEDYETFQKSFNDVYSLGADNLQLGFLKMLKGTSIRQQAKTYDYAYMEKAPYQVISNCFMNAKELCRLQRIEEVLDLYHNRGGFEQSLPAAICLTEKTAFDFYEAFSSYYYDCGFQHRSHKKEDLYRILYAFGQENNWGEAFSSLVQQDLEQTMNFDAVKKFKRKGWSILQVNK